jgi:capsular exopolysaccharide synthesis family protein
MNEDQSLTTSLTTILWRGKYLIAISLAVAVAGAVFITSRTAKVYEATATFQVSSSQIPNRGSSDALTSQLAGQGLAATYAALLNDRSFVEGIRPEIAGGDLSISDLQQRLSARAVANTGLLELNATGSSPNDARRLASEAATAFLASIKKNANTRTSDLQSEIESKIADLSSQIDKLARSPNANRTNISEQLDSLRGARSALTSQLATVIANAIEAGGSTTLTAPPTASSSPIRPRPLLNLVAGILLGLSVGFGLAWLRVRLDRGLHSGREAEELLGVPLLASIPIRKQPLPEDPILQEAYDVLRANLVFLSVEQAIRVLTVTSYNPDEGKTSTVEGLAQAAVRGGLRVLVIDGDTRKGTLSKRFGLGASRGLTNVIAGIATSKETIKEITPPGFAPGFFFLPSGTVAPNPPGLLSSLTMQKFVKGLRDIFQLIVIDSPPLAHLADAAILASNSDGVVLVARIGITERGNLSTAAASLRHSPTPLVGLVMLEPRSVDDSYYSQGSRSERSAEAETVLDS